nr:hypothetical protein [Tanacetum cinerariifolium]
MHVKEQLSYGEGPTSPFGTQHTPNIIETSLQLQNISNTYRKTRTKTRTICIRIHESNVSSSVADEAITKEMHDGLGRATTTASSLEAEQGSGVVPDSLFLPLAFFEPDSYQLEYVLEHHPIVLLVLDFHELFLLHHSPIELELVEHIIHLLKAVLALPHKTFEQFSHQDLPVSSLSS